MVRGWITLWDALKNPNGEGNGQKQFRILLENPDLLMRME